MTSFWFNNLPCQSMGNLILKKRLWTVIKKPNQKCSIFILKVFQWAWMWRCLRHSWHSGNLSYSTIYILKNIFLLNNFEAVRRVAWQPLLKTSDLLTLILSIWCDMSSLRRSAQQFIVNSVLLTLSNIAQFLMSLSVQRSMKNVAKPFLSHIAAQVIFTKLKYKFLKKEKKILKLIRTTG